MKVMRRYMNSAEKEKATKNLRIRKLPFAVNIMQLVGGGLLIFMVIDGASVNFSRLTGIIDGLNDNGFMDRFNNSISTGFTNDFISESERDLTYVFYLIAMIVFVVFLFPTLLWVVRNGFLYMANGLKLIMRPFLSGRVPKGYRNYGDVRLGGFRNQELQIYEPMGNFIKGIFGERSKYLSPLRREVVRENGSKLRKRIFRLTMSVISFVVLLGIINWLSSSSADNLFNATSWHDMRARMTGSTATNMIKMPFLLVIGLQIFYAIIEYLSTSMLIPGKEPLTESQQDANNYDGFTHPKNWLKRLPDAWKKLQLQDYPNHIQQGKMRTSKSNFPIDTIKFKTYLFIERQPQPIKATGSKAAYLLLVSGWFLQLFGFYLLVFELLPAPVRALQDTANPEPFAWAPFFVLAMFVATRNSIRKGRDFINQAYKLMQSGWFHSVAVFIDFDGNMNHDEDMVGDAATTSDFVARVWAAELISEAATMTDKRILLQLRETESSDKWLGTYINGIEEFRKV
jgi:hypothetical protein